MYAIPHIPTILNEVKQQEILLHGTRNHRDSLYDVKLPTNTTHIKTAIDDSCYTFPPCHPSIYAQRNELYSSAIPLNKKGSIPTKQHKRKEITMKHLDSLLRQYKSKDLKKDCLPIKNARVSNFKIRN